MDASWYGARLSVMNFFEDFVNAIGSSLTARECVSDAPRGRGAEEKTAAR
jgi:hypothetical protein